MDKSLVYSFTPVDAALKCLASKERKDQLLQYNVDKNLQIVKCRFTGAVPVASSDYDQLITDLFSSNTFLGLIGVKEPASSSVPVDTQLLKLTITSMAFFDKLQDSGTKRYRRKIIVSI